MTKEELILEQRTLEPGRPVIIWPGRRALRAAYDPAQIGEAQAVEAIKLIAPGAPDVLQVTRVGGDREVSQPRILQSIVRDGTQERAG